MKDCGYTGCSTKDILFAHYNRHHLELVENGKLLPSNRCVVSACMFYARYTKDMWDSHYQDRHPTSVKSDGLIYDGKSIIWDRCPQDDCEFGGYRTKKSWDYHKYFVPHTKKLLLEDDRLFIKFQW